MPGPIKNILTPKSGRIRELIHISDIHIRNGDEFTSRYDEYKSVFENLFSDLRKMKTIKEHSAAIVLTGDQFHHKSKLETYGIKLFMILMKNLGEIAPTYIILGNHDFQQDKVENGIDFLEAFDAHLPPNVCFLQETGLYQAGNVGFGLVSVKDTLKLGSGSGMADSLPDFPDPSNFPDEVEYKAALFHGTMKKSKFSEHRKADDGYSWNWLDCGYDIALLGDIHKQQVFPRRQSGLLAAYAGSLIQQNFGESLLKGHGYLVWKLRDGEADVFAKDVYNKYGLVKLTVQNGIWHCDNKLLSEVVENEAFPHKLKLRIFGSYTIDEYHNLKMILKDKEYIQEDYAIRDDNLKQTSDYATSALLDEYMKKNGVDNYEIPYLDDLKITVQEGWSELLKKIARKKNQDLEKEYNLYSNKIENSQQSKKICIKYVEWSGLLCYSGENWLDFDLMQGATNLISAKNGGGKSSFLEIICLAIFGKPIPTRSIKGNGYALIAKGKKEGKKSKTAIHILVDGTIYRINRIFDDDGKQKGRGIDVHRMLNEEWRLVCADAPKTNEWVSNNLGDIHGFLMTTMITQSNDDDFLSMKANEQRNHLEQIIGMKEANAKASLFKQAHICIKSFKNSLDIAYGSQGDNLSIGDEEELENVIKQYSEKQKILEKYSDRKEISWGICKIDDLEKDHETIQSTITMLEAGISKYRDWNRDSLLKEIALMESQINQYEENITDSVREKMGKEGDIELLDVEPIISLEECVSKKKEYNNWLGSKTVVNMSTRKIYSEIDTIKDKLEFKKNLFKSLHPPCAKPNPDLDEEYTKINSQFESIEQLYNNDDNKIVNQGCPHFEEGEIDRIEKEVKEESKESCCSIEEYKNSVEMFQKQKKEISEMKIEHQNITNVKDSNETREEQLYREHRELQKIVLPSSAISSELCIKNLKAIEEGSKNIEVNRRILKELKVKFDDWNRYSIELNDFKEERARVTKSLAQTELSLKDTPFNLNCEACCSQPLRKQLNALSNQLYNVNLNVQELEKRLCTKNPEKEYLELKETVEDYENVSIKKNEYQKLLKEWEEYNNNNARLTIVNDELDELRKLLIEMRTNLKDLTLNIKEKVVEAKKLKKCIETYEYHASKMIHWDERMAFVASVRAQWELYRRSTRTIEINEKYNNLKVQVITLKEQLVNKAKYDKYELLLNDTSSEIEQMEKHMNELKVKLKDTDRFEAEKAAWGAWLEIYERTVMEWDAYEYYLASVHEKKLWLLSSEKDLLNKKLNDTKIYTDYAKQLEYWRNVINTKNKYDDYIRDGLLIQELRNDIKELHGEKAKLEYSVLENNKIKEKANQLREEQGELESKIENLNILGRVFDEYRGWLYSEHILPNLVNRTNKLLHTVEPNLHLCYSMQQDGSFIFTARNEHHEVLMEKTSGFEYFMLSTCLRLSFITLTLGDGVLGGQLIIDEGFTTCDVNHLGKIPEFLQSLLAKFDSIVLVSHIERIKDSVDNTIMIRNKQMQYGALYDFVKPVLIRKRRKGNKNDEI
tara:strand:- start:3705 stop:8270 length:4566 start_codon:yes stop_codon:yes gene_type:complete